MSRFAKKNVRNLEDIEKWLAKERKIKFQDIDSLDSKYEVIKLMIRERPETCYVRGTLHTEEGRDRSLQDTLLTMKYYFRNTTYLDFVKEVLSFYRRAGDSGRLIQRIAYCPDINKHNFRIYDYPENSKYYLERSIARYIKRDLSYLFPNMSMETRTNIGIDIDNIVESMFVEE